DEVRMDAVRAKVLPELRELFLTDQHPAHAGAHDDADAMRIFPVHPEAGILDRLRCRHERQLRIAIETIGLDGLRQPIDVPVQHLTGDLGAITLERQFLEPGERGDARTAGEGTLPERVDADPDRRHDTEAGDDHAASPRGARWRRTMRRFPGAHSPY